MRRLLIGISATMLIAAACTAGGGDSGNSGPVSLAPTTGQHKPVTLTVWDYFTERELGNLTAVIKMFQEQYPWIKVNLVPGKSFGDYIRGINADEKFDVAIDPGPDNVARYCSTGAFIDMKPYITADHLDMAATFPPAALKYTSYNGTQCALPMLTDAYGLYYNKDLMAKAGITTPPKTLTEFVQDAKDMTQLNSDGSIKVAGFVPLSSFYENPNLYDGNSWNAQWYDDQGQSAFGTDPAWTQMMEWNKALVDFYGYDKLQAFYADLGGPNSEWNNAQAFENGKVAMAYDGEWRVSFIRDHNADVNYGTAPFPVADDHPELYGSGQSAGTIVGISKTAEHPAEAWLLTKFLTTNTESLLKLADLLFNVPTTYDSLEQTTLKDDPNFKTFLDIYKNPHSYFHPITPIGTFDADSLSSFMDKWEAGAIPDLQAGLDQLAQRVDQQSQLG
jgi:multiple sugar transport system substrate-binding protein